MEFDDSLLQPEDSIAPEEEKGEQEEKITVLSYLHELVYGIVAILFVFVLLFRLVVVSGPSMQHTLINADSLILLSNVFYNNPKYGDIVVISKQNFKDGEPFIKRVIATEGQTVDINFYEGVVYVDGVALDEPYVSTATNLYEGMSFPLVVEEGCVFVLGDNRNDSMDSRSMEIGQIDCREILGKAIFILLPAKNEETKERDWGRIGGLG